MRRLLALLALFALPEPALAGKPITVGDGTAASCTETALQDALTVAGGNGGGKIHFACGGSPVSILLTATLMPPDRTIIDGGGQITLESAVSPFLLVLVSVNSDTSVVLKNLSILHGSDGVSNDGTLAVHNSTFVGSTFSGIVNSGTLAVHGSVFSGEVFDVSGGGIFNGGTLIVDHSTFANNFGGGIFNGGTARVSHSTFADNQFPEGSGGAIANEGVLIVEHSTFANNVAGSRGGGIFNSGEATIAHSTFTDNVANLGGGLYNEGVLTIAHSTITQNTAHNAGGGIYTCCDGTMTLTHMTITGNTPDDVFPF